MAAQQLWFDLIASIGAKPKKEHHSDIVAKKVAKKLQKSTKRKAARAADEDDDAAVADGTGDTDDGADTRKATVARYVCSMRIEPLFGTLTKPELLRCRHVAKIAPLDVLLDEKAKKKRKKGKKQASEHVSDASTPQCETLAPPQANQFAKVDTVTSKHVGNAADLDDSVWASNWEENLPENPESTTKTNGGDATPQVQTSRVQSATVRSVAPQPQQKWKKVRSKRKNLKKDTRPEHLKPTYLTEGSPDFRGKTKIPGLYKVFKKNAGRGGRDGAGKTEDGRSGQGRGGGGAATSSQQSTE